MGQVGRAWSISPGQAGIWTGVQDTFLTKKKLQVEMWELISQEPNMIQEPKVYQIKALL